MQPQHVRSYPSPVLEGITSSATDNLANSCFCWGHHNEASRCGNSFILVVILETEVSCPCESLSQHKAFCNSNSQKQWCVCQIHAQWLQHVGGFVSVCFFLYHSVCVDPPGRNINVRVAVGEWAQPLQHHVALSNCLTAFFLPFMAPG